MSAADLALIDEIDARAGDREWTHGDVAFHLGWPPQRLPSRLGGHASFSLADIADLAKLFDCDVDELVNIGLRALRSPHNHRGLNYR